MKKIRYAVVGQGYISQAAVLPAFAHAPNSELKALVSGDSLKLQELAKKYDVEKTYSYDQYEECLNSGEIDAVYIALPNTMHREYTIRAARSGIHVLCEKPMACTIEDCEKMIEETDENDVKLMIAYRLHFEKANLQAMEIAKSKELGDLRFFHSNFSMQVKKGNSRLEKNLAGGGPLYDIGIYCINAARNLFEAEPTKVFAVSASAKDDRFKEVEEMTTAILYFADNRVASFTCSFGASDVSNYELVGTKGSLRVEPAYELAEGLGYTLKIAGQEKKKAFTKRDQFAPELIYFSDCILNDKHPVPSGHEGLADVRVIQALYESAQKGEPVLLDELKKQDHLSMDHEKTCPPVSKKKLIHAEAPSA